jgi:hypothetical protein
MDLSKIISVAGKPGLYRIVAQGRQALIVESLIDGKRAPIHSSVRVSSLEEISMFTTGDDVPLSKVLESLHTVEKGGATLDPKEEEDKLFAKLGEALPEHDRSRIYPSDVRKLFSWYALLLKSGDFTKKEEKVEEVVEETEKTAKGAKKTPAAGAKKAKVAAKVAAPKPAGTSKAKATTMRKSAQRGS